VSLDHRELAAIFGGGFAGAVVRETGLVTSEMVPPSVRPARGSAAAAWTWRTSRSLPRSLWGHMEAKLYWFPLSHPAQAVRKMLELKGIPYESVGVIPGMQRVHLRLAGFRRGTVPAVKLDGQRVQGSVEIARALEQLTPDPPLFPADSALRAEGAAAERWGEAEFQSLPRLIIRWGLVHDLALRRWMAKETRLPAPALAAHAARPTARYYARVVGADEAAARRAVTALPESLRRADALLAAGTLATDPPNAAALQILSTVRSLDAFADLHELVSAHRVAAAAEDLFPDFPGPVPRFIPQDWLGATAATADDRTPG